MAKKRTKATKKTRTTRKTRATKKKARRVPHDALRDQYETVQIENVPADELAALIRRIRSDPRHVSHAVVPETDGEFTVIVVYRV